MIKTPPRLNAVSVGAAGRRSIAPGGAPTMGVNDNAFIQNTRVALKTIASKLAPTVTVIGIKPGRD
jgi:hypothetical protein